MVTIIMATTMATTMVTVMVMVMDTELTMLRLVPHHTTQTDTHIPHQSRITEQVVMLSILVTTPTPLDLTNTILMI